MYEQILTGVIGGIAVALAGIAKKNPKEAFLWSKIIPTLIISAIVGGVAGYMNQDYGLVANSAIAAGITSVVENTWKGISKRIFK